MHWHQPMPSSVTPARYQVTSRCKSGVEVIQMRKPGTWFPLALNVPPARQVVVRARSLTLLTRYSKCQERTRVVLWCREEPGGTATAIAIGRPNKKWVSLVES